MPQASQGVQAWDRYAYVNNSPIGNSDPSGHCPICLTALIGGAAGAIVGAVGYTVYAAANQQKFNTGTMLAVAGGGAIAGALIGTGVGIAAGVGVAEATAASVAVAGAAETANTACGGDMCASEGQEFSNFTEEALPAIENEAQTAVQDGFGGLSKAAKYGVDFITIYAIKLQELVIKYII